MNIASKIVKWISPKLKVAGPVNPETGAPTEVGQEFNFSYDYRVPATLDEAVELCGSVERVCSLIGQKMATFANTKKAAFDEATTEDAANQIIAKIVEEGPKYDLTATRGNSENAINAKKAVEHDKLQAILTDPATSMEDKMAALAAMGYAPAAA